MVPDVVYQRVAEAMADDKGIFFEVPFDHVIAEAMWKVSRAEIPDLSDG